jgi:hypothetical protein
MAAKNPPKGVSEYLAEIGRKGGERKVPKGFATLTDEERRAAAAKGVATRRANAKKKGPKKAKTRK